MRILILGAGGIGAYIGAGLLATLQADVSFLVRERRWQQLQQHGLQIESQFGNLSIAHPQTCKEIPQVFDVVINPNGFRINAAILQELLS
jgi:2-dehydropantoate 2-reductase